MSQIVRVALDVPLRRLFDYQAPAGKPLAASDRGCRVLVPFGAQRKVGVIVDLPTATEIADSRLKPCVAVLRDLPPLPEDWFALTEFCAAYYQAPLGQVMLSTLPAGLRATAQRSSRRQRAAPRATPAESPLLPPLTVEQADAVAVIAGPADGYRAYLLHGVTGSGKTEVYLRLMARVLAAGRQVLLLVPEINLTPQLEARIGERFPTVAMVSLHSELGEAARRRNWLAAFSGAARIVLGTRLAVFTPMPDLALIVVDEEHDASFKQQDGVRYSARDLAVFRAHQRQIPIVLGSATPALESFANAIGDDARYRLLSLRERAVEGARLPRVLRIDTRIDKPINGLTAALQHAIETRLQRYEQSLLFLNRRGYAPVLACAACGWRSGCRRCAAHLVLHVVDACLRCHHCGYCSPVPKACPGCGNQDLSAFGRGTQRLEGIVAARFPAARIVRVDRDSASSRAHWQALAAEIGRGDYDILVGTQMLAKGHDFPNLTLVGVVAPDAALFAADWRAPEQLFAQLMQVAGRAGRADRPGEVLLQTQYPEHPLYEALARHDYSAFAASQLAERRQAGFPPFVHQAMLRAEAATMAAALAFLQTARARGAPLVGEQAVTFYDPVPMRLSRRASRERGQLLVESPSRRVLQTFLGAWVRQLEGIRCSGVERWHLEVDPLEF